MRIDVPVAPLARTVRARSSFDRVPDLLSGVTRDRHPSCILGVQPRRAEAAAVPWGSHGILSVAKHEAEHVLLGPALFGEKQTVLRVVEQLGPETPGDPLSIARRWRKAHGTDVQAVG